MKTIYVACTGGMGSSALAASLLKKAIKRENLDYKVKNISVSDIDESVDIIICHQELLDDVKRFKFIKKIYTINDYIENTEYERIVKTMKNNEILSIENIEINCKATDSDQAIISAGNMLVKAGYVEEKYIEGMLARDHSLSVYMGNDLAIPHGEFEYKKYIKKTGISVQIYPDGVLWHGEKARIVIGIAANNDDHMEILSNIAMKLCEMEAVNHLVACNEKEEILNILTKEG